MTAEELSNAKKKRVQDTFVTEKKRGSVNIRKIKNNIIEIFNNVFLII